MIRAKGVTLSRSTPAFVMRITALAPSLRVLALAAVTVPLKQYIKIESFKYQQFPLAILITVRNHALSYEIITAHHPSETQLSEI